MSAYAPQRKRDLVLTDNYLTLAKYIFIQAIKDASALRADINYKDKYKGKHKENNKEDAIRWLKQDGYWWITSVIGIDADPIRFIETIRDVEKMEMPAGPHRYVRGVGQRVKKKKLDHEFLEKMRIKTDKQKQQNKINN